MYSVLKKCRWPIAVGFYLICSFVFGHGMSDADKAKALEATNWDFVELGASHMVTGYDHLLFLFGVVFSLQILMTLLNLSRPLPLGIRLHYFLRRSMIFKLTTTLLML